MHGAFVDIEKKLGSFHLRANLTVETEKLALLGASGCVSSCRWTVRRRLEAFCRFPSGKRRCFSINDVLCAPEQCTDVLISENRTICTKNRRHMAQNSYKILNFH